MFNYTGREQFEDLWIQASKMKKDPHEAQLFLCGTMGYGKSHLLACLACLLIKEGETVVYLPDCRAMLWGVVPYVKAAMLLTFGDGGDMQEEVQQLSSMEDIQNFFEKRSPEDIFFIIDQWNALELEKDISRDNVSNDQKSRAQQFLDMISATHRRIWSASANYLTFRYMEQKQRNEITIYVQGGLTKVSEGYRASRSDRANDRAEGDGGMVEQE